MAPPVVLFSHFPYAARKYWKGLLTRLSSVSPLVLRGAEPGHPRQRAQVEGPARAVEVCRVGEAHRSIQQGILDPPRSIQEAILEPPGQSSKVF